MWFRIRGLASAARHLARLLRSSARRSLCPRPSSAASPAPPNSCCLRRISGWGYRAAVDSQSGEDRWHRVCCTDWPSAQTQRRAESFVGSAQTSTPIVNTVLYSTVLQLPASAGNHNPPNKNMAYSPKLSKLLSEISFHTLTPSDPNGRHLFILFKYMYL